ncbi:hypothetical protein FBULB1_8799 [Fusarium bulbicola]|nr:hypothetical protein FBULB1_8799 [Fusarium bulbicola]
MISKSQDSKSRDVRPYDMALLMPRPLRVDIRGKENHERNATAWVMWQMALREKKKTSNVTNVFVCQSAEPETFAAKVPVVKNTAFTDVTKRELQSLSSHSSMATAACLNVSGWDVRVASLANSVTAIDRHDDYAPVFLPWTMPQSVGEALVSLMVPGGPVHIVGAKTTPLLRLQSGAKACPPLALNTMPFYVRQLFLGGSTRTLVIRERTTGSWLFGGAMPTSTHIAARQFWVTISSPVDSRLCTAETTLLEATLVGVCQWTLPRQTSDTDPAPPTIRSTLHRDAFARAGNFRMPNSMAARWCATRRPSRRKGGCAQRGRVVFRTARNEVWTYWTAQHQGFSAWVPLEAIMARIIDPATANDEDLLSFSRACINTLSPSLYSNYTADNRWGSDEELRGFRNSFCFDDAGTFCISEFNTLASAPLVAGVYLVNVTLPRESNFNLTNRRLHLLKYVANMHIAHAFTAAGRKL